MNIESIRERLLYLETASLCDAGRELRVLDPEIRPVRSGLKLAGRAHTVSCKDDFLTVIKALQESLPGEVLVIDAQGSRRALVGELFSTEAYRKGLAGIVVDGAVRDTRRIRNLPVPVYSRTVTPVAGGKERIFETQVPVTCGGVTIHPGDVLLGDDDGIVVATEREMEELIPIAEAIRAKEEAVLAHVEEGESLFQVLAKTRDGYDFPTF